MFERKHAASAALIRDGIASILHFFDADTRDGNRVGASSS